MQDDKPIASVGWTSRLISWEFLAVVAVLAAFLTVGIVTTLRHGELPRGGITMIPAHANSTPR